MWNYNIFTISNRISRWRSVYLPSAHAHLIYIDIQFTNQPKNTDEALNKSDASSRSQVYPVVSHH